MAAHSSGYRLGSKSRLYLLVMLMVVMMMMMTSCTEVARGARSLLQVLLGELGLVEAG